MNLFRTWCATLFGYDWVGIPLVYTQACLSTPCLTSVAITCLSGCNCRSSNHIIGLHYCNPIRGRQGGADGEVSALSLSAGRHSRRLHLLLRLSDWPPVPRPRPGVRRPRPRPVRPRLHPAAVLLLLRLAEGAGVDFSYLKRTLNNLDRFYSRLIFLLT